MDKCIICSKECKTNKHYEGGHAVCSQKCGILMNDESEGCGDE